MIRGLFVDDNDTTVVVVNRTAIRTTSSRYCLVCTTPTTLSCIIGGDKATRGSTRGR